LAPAPLVAQLLRFSLVGTMTVAANATAAMVAEIVAELRVSIDAHNEPLDNLWMLFGAILVFFMHTGFSMLETGTVRFKNAQNILSKNLLVVCLGFIMWYFFGWGFAFGTDAGKFVGSDGFFGAGILGTSAMRNWFFQGAFSATAGTIVSGAMAERTQITGFAIYASILTTLIYPFVVHWTWSGSGFLSYTDEVSGDSTSFVGVAYKDFAGSGIVHMVGGIGALIGALIVGPRTGRFDAGAAEEFAPHNVPLCVLGTFVLWFGWYGFNGASTLSMKTSDDAFSAALVCINTTLSPSIAGLTLFILRAKVIAPKRFDVCGICNGILAGLVSITAPCGSVEPWEALIIGFIGAWAYQGASMLMQKLKIDDPLDAFAVHGVCGCWGVLAAGIFGAPDTVGGNGLFYGGDQIGVQIVAALIIAAWVTGISVPIFLVLKKVGLLRVHIDVEEVGLDEHEHSPSKSYMMEDDPAKKRASEARVSEARVSESAKATSVDV